jgi:hypothetical protein
MEKIIKVGTIEVQERSCMVGFNVYCELSTMSCMEITHNTLYKLLDSATGVKQDGNAIVFKQGIVEFRAYPRVKE